jgi:hypothetical protein
MSDVFNGGTPRVEDLVGEGKKYATSEVALQSLPHKELLIDSLQKQVKDLHDELSKAKALEEVLESLKKPQETPATIRQEPNAPAESTKEMEARLQAALEAMVSKSVAEAVPKAASEQSEQRVRAENRQAVSAALQAAFGDTAPQVLAEKAKELGVTVQELGALSERSPKAVLAYFQVSGSAGTGSVNTQANSQGGAPKEGTYAWWNQMRKTDPAKYHDPKMQTKLFADRKRLGEAFYT